MPPAERPLRLLAWSSGRAQDKVADHFAMVCYIGTGGDEHYVGLAEAALVPFEKGRMARDIPAYHDIAHAGPVLGGSHGRTGGSSRATGVPRDWSSNRCKEPASTRPRKPPHVT